MKCTPDNLCNAHWFQVLYISVPIGIPTILSQILKIYKDNGERHKRSDITTTKLHCY